MTLPEYAVKNKVMIPRYTTPEMAQIWSQDTKFQNWLEIELLALEAMEKLGIAPPHTASKIRQTAKINISRIDAIELETRHDVIAFLTSITEQVGAEGKYLHQGMTSSDIIDTAYSLTLRNSGLLIQKRLDALLTALKKQSQTHAETLCIGRSHGIHAEPTTFGLKMAGHFAAFKRCQEKLGSAIAEVSICAISGPVGTHATCPPDIQNYVAGKLGLKPEIISTQIIPRDRYAYFFSVLGIIAGCIENLATEIRHLQRSEVREVEEFFHAGQKGSSAMPHKRNPVLSENITGLARVIRAAVTPALENITLWHERDISHSSVERTILPDAIMACDFTLQRFAGVIDTLLVYPETMRKNIDALGGLIYSQKVLLALINSGLSREDAYKIVQQNAMKVWDCGFEHTFLDVLANDKNVTKHINQSDLEKLFHPNDYVIHAQSLIANALK